MGATRITTAGGGGGGGGGGAGGGGGTKSDLMPQRKTTPASSCSALALCARFMYTPPGPAGTSNRVKLGRSAYSPRASSRNPTLREALNFSQIGRASCRERG